MSWEQGYDAGNSGLIAAVNTAKMLGAIEERKRIIKLLEEHKDGDLLFAQDLNTPSKDVAYTMFKGDVIALIKGENKASHTHEIEVFGAPCDCGTRHEYCGDCDWVEPCEPEGESK